jgi:hypothetical protein
MLAFITAVLIIAAILAFLYRLGRLDVNSDGKVNKEDALAIRDKVLQKKAAEESPVEAPTAPVRPRRRSTKNKLSPVDTTTPEQPTEPLDRKPGDTGEAL